MVEQQILWRIAQLESQLAKIEERQRQYGERIGVVEVVLDNERIRHAKTPQLTISLVSIGISILFFVLQVVVARVGAP